MEPPSSKRGKNGSAHVVCRNMQYIQESRRLFRKHATRNDAELQVRRQRLADVAQEILDEVHCLESYNIETIFAMIFVISPLQHMRDMRATRLKKRLQIHLYKNHRRNPHLRLMYMRHRGVLELRFGRWITHVPHNVLREEGVLNELMKPRHPLKHDNHRSRTHL